MSLHAKARIRLETMFSQGKTPNEELLLGPAYATYQVLQRQGLSIKDFDVFEYHEAFAAQILTNLKCIDSSAFAKEKIRATDKSGEINEDKFNIHGGSLSLGHPFGATGARLVTTAVNRLQREDSELAILAACAAGAHGHTMVLERVGQQIQHFYPCL